MGRPAMMMALYCKRVQRSWVQDYADRSSRYLRARKFDVDGAYGQFTDTEKWLKEQRVEELYENFDVEHYEQARRMVCHFATVEHQTDLVVQYPQWTGHRDKRGIPIYLFVIRHLDTKAVNKYQKAATAYKDSLPNHKNSSHYSPCTTTCSTSSCLSSPA